MDASRSMSHLAAHDQPMVLPRASGIAFFQAGGSLSTMWLRELKQREFEDLPALDGEDQVEEERGFSLTKEEHARLTQAGQSLRDELAAAVRHIDPSEYSQERLQQLLTEANQKPTSRRPRAQRRKT